MRKKRTAGKYDFVWIIISIAIPLLAYLLWPIVEHLGNVGFSRNGHIINFVNKVIYFLAYFLIFVWVISVPLSFLVGLKALIKSIREKGKFTDYLKSSCGMIVAIFWVLLILAIAIPIVFRFTHRAKQSEAKQNLQAIYSAYQQYHSDHDTYPNSPTIQIGDTTYNCINITGWEPKGTMRYNYNCMKIEAFSPPVNDYPCPDEFAHANKASFTIAACGNVDNDTFVDVWTIDDASHLRNVRDDAWDKKR